ncbi:hypothetical protein [Rhodoferax sp.]|uniref:hypothetical protein n=1 Tax=Rhodoferax sp. TaxID=50421 RepID=UPI001EC11B38|nr:hypothetical protein [Rhodoferax sp.]MBT9508199.1 hypothetical protein [Rhodoferax sp.]
MDDSQQPLTRDEAYDKLTSLIPKNQLEAEANLAEYIRFAKNDLIVLGANLPWAAWRWENVGTFAKQGVVRGLIGKPVAAELMLDATFIDFAKAYVRERHSHNPNESMNGHINRLRCLRVLEMALLEVHGCANPILVDHRALNQAVTFSRKYFSERTAYQTGINLQSIADLLVKKKIIPTVVRYWTSPISDVRKMGYAVGTAGDKARAEKLPDQQALRALSEVSNHRLETDNPDHQRDIYTTSVTALLLSAPSRGGDEVHLLPLNLDFKATDKFGKDQMGLLWNGSKGFGRYTKWVWEGIVPVAERAIGRLKAMTEDARKLARWLEDPKTCNHFYRHPACPDVGDEEPLTWEQVCNAMGYVQDRSSLHSYGLSAKNCTHTLQELWRDHILPQHKKDHPYFPYVSRKEAAKGVKGGLKFSQALFCMQVNQLAPRSGTSPVKLWMPNLKTYGREVGKSFATTTSIFDRHGYKGDDGEPLQLRSHQIRHLLNTEGQRGKMTEEEIAWWSGRIDLAQNEVYNGMTEQERVDRDKGILANEHGHVVIVKVNPYSLEPKATGSIETYGHWQVDSRKPASLHDLDVQPKLTNINTLWGRCEHDYALSPCEGFANCLACSEHVCIKGNGQDDREKLDRIQGLMSRVATEIEKANAQIEEGDWGAEEWLDHQTKWHAKLQQLVEILQSSKTEDGARIKISGANSQIYLHRVLRNVAMTALENNTLPKDVIQEMLEAIKQEEPGIKTITFHPGRPFSSLDQADTIDGKVTDGA